MQKDEGRKGRIAYKSKFEQLWIKRISPPPAPRAKPPTRHTHTHARSQRQRRSLVGGGRYFFFVYLFVFIIFSFFIFSFVFVALFLPFFLCFLVRFCVRIRADATNHGYVGGCIPSELLLVTGVGDHKQTYTSPQEPICSSRHS